MYDLGKRLKAIHMMESDAVESVEISSLIRLAKDLPQRQRLQLCQWWLLAHHRKQQLFAKYT